MTRIYSKYFYMFAVTIISLMLLNGGCATQPEKIVTLEKKLNTLSKSIEGLEPEINVLREKFDKQESGIESTLSSQRNVRSRLEGGLSETGKMIEEIKKNLVIIDADKEEMKAQLEELRTQLKGLETQLEKLEYASKSASTRISLINDLLDEAIKLYRHGKFEDAISKWEEVLARDPDKLDAKFNIEIAKDRIKEKQIHEEMKALLIQRK